MWKPTLLIAAALGACVANDDTQTISGRVERTGFDGMALGARVVQGDAVVVTAPLAADGSFTVTVPAGTGYRLEIITSTGAHPFVQQAGAVLIEETFDVCDPIDPYDLGDVYQGDEIPDDWGEPGDPTWCPDGTMPDADGTCTGGTEPGCGDPPPPDWCPDGVPEEECWDPCSWDPMACDDPCALYPETCDPCAADPSLCEDPCLEHPEWCEDPCSSDDPAGCDPCVEHPELCDPCLADPSLCDPCATRPELCEDPCASDPTLCEDPCALYPELCDPCMGDPSLCDPCLEHPELCEDPCVTDPTLCESPCSAGMDGSYDDPTCWPPPDDMPCDASGVCEPGGCAVPEAPIPDFGCGA